ncbi:MAG: ABC transporter substrate-binding protein [Oscillospiraceae bacterium]|nr:ABC transporter substrate-binding protein [Oscillospiraceae bacterium]
MTRFSGRRGRLAALAVCLMLLCGCMQRIASDSTLFTTLLPESSAASGAAEEPGDISSLRVAYNEGDGLNPYKMKSEINLKLVPLLYDSLFKLDGNFSPEPCIARSCTREGGVCTVELREDIRFSDGTALTAEDVLYSAGLAMSEGSYWQQSLKDITEVSASGSRVVFVFEEADAFCSSLLTFPVIKKGTEEAPVGSGRYRRGTEEGQLVLNENWYGGGLQRIKTIQLISQPDKETLIYSLKVGTIDYIYSSLSENTDSAAGGSFQYVSLPNLIYLGMNRQNSLLAQPAFRQALEAAIDREDAVENSYYERAQAAPAPFPSGWGALSGLDYSRQPDTETAYSLLAGLGLSARNEEGRLLSSGGEIDLTLLVNAENSYRCEAARQIEAQLERAGIGVTVEEADFADYQSRISAGDYDLFLAETRLEADMDLSALLSPEGALAYGGRDEALWNIYLQFRAGTVPAEDFLAAFYESVPLIPIAYRRGVVFFTREIYYGVETTEQDIFYNIQDW